MKKAIFLALIFSLAALPALAAAPDGAVGPWADTVITSSQGLKKNGDPVAADRSDTTDALGVAESTGTPYDNPVVAGSFFSLGFGGTITLAFDNAIVNAPGHDLQLYEVTGGTSYPDELVDVEASHNGVDWVLVANDVTRDATIDLGILSCAAQIRITDSSNIALFEATADGYDLDGVKALHTDEVACDIEAQIQVVKTASSLEVFTDEEVTYTYEVTNIGDFDLDNVVVSDDKCAPVNYVSGDDGDNILEDNETWVYECTQALVETTTNIVTVIADDPFDNQVSGTDEETVAVKAPGCTLTQGYWKTHSSFGPAPYDPAWDGHESDIFAGSGLTYYDVLQTPVKGRPWYQLAHQNIAAWLNVYQSGASAPQDVLDALDDAWTLLNSYTEAQINALKGKDAQTIRQQFTTLAGILGSYNEGLIGPGHCSDVEEEV